MRKTILWVKMPLLFAGVCFVISAAIGQAAGSPTQELENALREIDQPAIPVNSTGAKQAPPPELKHESSSTDFLMLSSSFIKLSVVSSPSVIPVEPLPSTATLQSNGFVSIVKEEENVAMLTSEACEQIEGAASGALSCHRIYSNGHHAQIVTQRATLGDEYKQQSVITEFDRENNLLYTKTVRHRIDYNFYQGEDRGKEREFFDVIYEPVGKKISRELLIYKYHPNSQKVKSMTWAQYEQIGHSATAGLVYHAALYYDKSGRPERGVAEKWEHGKKIADYLNWSSLRQGTSLFNKNSWAKWESWLKSIFLQAYLR